MLGPDAGDFALILQGRSIRDHPNCQKLGFHGGIRRSRNADQSICSRPLYR
jgi:hypothetical protein